METKKTKNLATYIHLSTLSQYFFPFGNYIFPLLIWSLNKDKSEFIDHNGKQVLNFQLSIFLYSLILLLLAIPMLISSILNNNFVTSLLNEGNVEDLIKFENINKTVFVGIIVIILLVGLKIFEFFFTILASLKATNGEKYNYPITINFIK